mmetsp:Transcript_24558/g.68950  ORF Transcript_24558/g.68950 Transcript_24558/m.68950 type:complete len:86 (-) Transcript_24558:911-1168(-)
MQMLSASVGKCGSGIRHSRARFPLWFRDLRKITPSNLKDGHVMTTDEHGETLKSLPHFRQMHSFSEAGSSATRKDGGTLDYTDSV